MTRSEKLTPALGLLEFKLNKEFTALANIMQKKIENDQKLVDLLNYKKNYSISNKKVKTITSVKLHHGLMNKLQQAIDMQQQVVEKLELNINEKIDKLKKNRAQTKALETLIGRYRQQEIMIHTRNEQKELDSQILAMLQSD